MCEVDVSFLLMFFSSMKTSWLVCMKVFIETQKASGSCMWCWQPPLVCVAHACVARVCCQVDASKAF